MADFDKIDGDDDSGISTIYIYKMFLAKEKALFQTLNMMKWHSQTFTGYFWAPVDQQNYISERLSSYSAVRISVYENHNIARPTYIKTNKFTAMSAAMSAPIDLLPCRSFATLSCRSHAFSPS